MQDGSGGTGGASTSARWGTRVLAAALAVLATLGWSVPADAQQPDGVPGVQVTVDAVASGHYIPGRPVALVVAVTAERAVRGDLRVRAAGWDGDWQQVEHPVEVAAGATVEVVAVLPAAATAGGAFVIGPAGGGISVATTAVGGGAEVAPSTELTVDAVLEVGDDEAVAVTSLAFTPGEEVVGVLPGLAEVADLPGTVALRGGGPPAPVVALDDRALEAGLATLSAYGTLLAGPADLEVDAPHGGALTAWVAQGGHLVVATDADDDLGGAVPALVPEARGPRAVGAGTVRRAQGVSGRGIDDLLDPSGAGWAPQDGLVGVDRFGDGGLDVPPAGLGEAAGLGGSGLVAARWLALLYVLLVGPVLFTVLRITGRRTLAWACIPALAAVGSIAMVVVGLDRFSDARAVHTSAVVVAGSPDGATAEQGQVTSVVLAPRTGGSTVDIATAGPAQPADVPLQQVEVATMVDAGDRLLASPSLDPGTAVAVGVTQAAAVEGAPTVVLAVDGEGVQATVANPGERPLRSAILITPTGPVDVGDLAPGASQTVGLPPSAPNRVEEPLWNVRCPTCDVQVDLTALVHTAAGPQLRAPGTVTLVGMVEDAPVPVEVEGREVRAGITALVVPVPVVWPSTDGPPLPAAAAVGADRCPRLTADALNPPTGVATRTWVGVPPGARAEDAGMGEGAVLRLDLVGGAAPEARLVLPPPLDALDVWTEVGWEPVAAGCALPAEATATGTVLVRTRQPRPTLDPGPFAGAAAFVGGPGQGWTAPYRELGLAQRWTEADGG